MSANTNTAAIDPDLAVALHDGGKPSLRNVLGRYVTGVTVVTTVYRGAPVGVTVNSFTSLSLDPPLILWCLHRKSATRTAFTTAPYFAVNVLRAEQRALAARFAGPGDRFPGSDTVRGPHGIPLIADSAATVICRRDRHLTAGDHIVLIGAVVEHLARPGPTLVFHDGGYFASDLLVAGSCIGRERAGS